MLNAKLWGLQMQIGECIENHLSKNKRFDPNKCDICSRNIIVDFHSFHFLSVLDSMTQIIFPSFLWGQSPHIGID